MPAKAHSCAVIGLDALPVQVEVDITNVLEKITVIDLPDAAVRESSKRVLSAITYSGLFFPSHRVAINLAPAATRQLISELDDALMVGELSFDGDIRLTEKDEISCHFFIQTGGEQGVGSW